MLAPQPSSSQLDLASRWSDNVLNDHRWDASAAFWRTLYGKTLHARQASDGHHITEPLVRVRMTPTLVDLRQA